VPVLPPLPLLLLPALPLLLPALPRAVMVALAAPPLGCEPPSELLLQAPSTRQLAKSQAEAGAAMRKDRIFELSSFMLRVTWAANTRVCFPI